MGQKSYLRALIPDVIHFTWFTDDLVLRIFQYMPARSRAAIMQTCKRFHDSRRLKAAMLQTKRVIKSTRKKIATRHYYLRPIGDYKGIPRGTPEHRPNRRQRWRKR